MVPGGHSPHNQGSAHTLQHVLGNLGGRPKNWMLAPPPATTPAPPFSTNPPPFAAPGQARRNVHAPHQPHMLSTLAPAFASTPAPVPLSQTLVPGAAPDAAPPMIPAFPAGAAGGSYTPETPLEHVYMDAARHGSALHRPTHDGPAQQTRACQVQTSTQGQPVAPANRTIAPSRLVTGYTPGYTHPYFPHHSPSSVHPPSNTHSPSNMHPPGSAHSPTGEFPPSNVSPANSPMLDPGYAHASFASNQPSSHIALSHSSQNSQPANQGPNRIVLQVPTPEGSPHNPFNRTTSPLPWYTQEDCFNILNGFQGSTFQPQALNVQSKRLTVLRGAIERNDWLYLTMHQFHCMLTICPDSLPMDLRNLPKLPEAVGVLDAVLEPNQVLDPAALSFFSNFPFPMQTICVTWGPMFEQQLYQLRLFVSKIGNFEQLKHKCEQQHYLPLAPELANTLGVNSVTFQSLIFTSLLRYIWRFSRNHPAQTHFETMAAKMLGKSQFECYHRPYPLDPVSFQDQFRIHSLQLKHIVEEFDNIFQGRNTHDHHHHTSPRQQLQHPQLQHPQPQPQHPQSNVETQRSVDGLPAQNPTPPIRAPQGLTPRPATAFAPTPPRLQQKQTQQGALLRSLDWVHPQSRVPYPARFSLHQAHLRSPVLCAESDSFPLYTFYNGFINPPVRLSKRGRFVESWTFTVPSDRLQFLAKTDHEPAGGPGKKSITESSQMVRLRCVKWKRDEEVPEEPVWAITDTSWMPYAYFSFNDKPLELRRKAQNGKDLAVDLTDLIKEGENTLEIAIVAESDNTLHFDYLIAVEVVAVLSHDSIKKHSCRNRVPADEILQNIKNQLSVSGGDDEISVIQSNLTISLRDPFSQTKMCDTPVRSKTCRHNDCFDLDVFLESRPRKGDASVADQWRCPICGCDARPHMLFFDGFIDSVRHQLEIQGLADTRQIVMQQDGSWEPKAEVQDNSASARGESNGPPASETARTSVPADVEVIDLSD